MDVAVRLAVRELTIWPPVCPAASWVNSRNAKPPLDAISAATAGFFENRAIRPSSLNAGFSLMKGPAERAIAPEWLTLTQEGQGPMPSFSLADEGRPSLPAVAAGPGAP